MSGAGVGDGGMATRHADAIIDALVQPFTETDLEGVSGLGAKTSGKVRDIYRTDQHVYLVCTDRLSAFDTILGTVPYKGQVLTELAAFWFRETADIVNSHLVALPDPNVTVGVPCEVIPVEVIVRGYITGVTSTALWHLYEQGHRSIYGIDFPDGLQKDDRLPTPIITPTTKAEAGAHDERLTEAEIIETGLVEPALWDKVRTAALGLFERGQQIAERAGLTLVDTKYEFGVDPATGDLTVLDEIHTPDSSRYWWAGTTDNADKEFIRLAYVDKGYRGEGTPPPLEPQLAMMAAGRYIDVYERLTDSIFAPAPYPAAERVAANLGRYRP